jgi:hypothetical protein
MHSFSDRIIEQYWELVIAVNWKRRVFVLDGQESQVVTGLAGRKAGERAVAVW